jgi:hypothetical protein
MVEHASHRVPRATRALLLSLVLAWVPVPSMAQPVAMSAPPADTQPVVRVSVDLGARAFDRVLPFDVPFFIAGRAPQGTLGLELQYAVVPKSGDMPGLVWMPSEPARWNAAGPTDADKPFLVLVPTRLEAGRVYRVRLVFMNEQVGGATTTILDGRTAQEPYISADAGFLYAGDIAIGALYAGTNIYFRPVNKDAPLGEISSIGRRLALTLGLTLSSVADEHNRTRSDLFWNQSLVLGAGYRLTSSLRGGGGVIVFRESDQNPLVTRKTAAITWYVSFSLDLDVAKAVRGSRKSRARGSPES